MSYNKKVSILTCGIVSPELCVPATLLSLSWRQKLTSQTTVTEDASLISSRDKRNSNCEVSSLGHVTVSAVRHLTAHEWLSLSLSRCQLSDTSQHTNDSHSHCRGVVSPLRCQLSYTQHHTNDPHSHCSQSRSVGCLVSKARLTVFRGVEFQELYQNIPFILSAVGLTLLLTVL